jgi:hypothetical protein
MRTDPEPKEKRQTIAYAALHRTLRYRGEDTGLYVAALVDGTMFFSRHQPPLYDRQGRPVPVREVLPGSLVNIKYVIERGINWMGAVQVVREPAQERPFAPVSDDGLL